MRLAISTNSLASTTPQALIRAADLGFRTVEINLDSAEFGYGYQRRPNATFYRDLKAQLDALDLQVWSVTPPQLTQAQLFSPRARKEILLGTIGVGGILGARALVAEPVHIFTDEDAVTAYFSQRTAPPILAGFDEAWAQATNRKMTIALLNIGYWLGQPLTNQVQRMAQVTFDLGIGAALSVDNALKSEPLPAWLHELSSRIAVAYGDVEGVSAETYAPLISQKNLKCLVLNGNLDADDAVFTTAQNTLTAAIQAAAA